MNPPLGARWAVFLAASFAAGLVALEFPLLGAVVALLGAAVVIRTRGVPAPARLAGALTVALAGLLPALALARDPYHARPPASAWPLPLVAAAFLGVGGAAWALVAGRNRAPPPGLPPFAPVAGDGSPRATSRIGNGAARLLLVEISAFALFLPISIAGTQLALLAATATLGWAYLRGARARLSTPLDAPVLLLLVAALSSDLLTLHPPGPGSTALRALAAFFVLSRALALAGPDDRALSRIVAVWLAAATLACALAFFQRRTGFDLVAALGLRAAVRVVAPQAPGRFAGIGTFESRLRFAHSLAMPLAMLLGIAVAGGRVRWQPWMWAVALAGAAGIWAALARAAWLALAAVAGAAAGCALATGEAGEPGEARTRSGLPASLTDPLRWPAFLHGRAAMLGGLAAITGAAALLFASSAGARAWGLAALHPSDNRDRLFLWARAAEIAEDHPLRGVGFGGYTAALRPYYDRLDPSFPMRTWAHDTPLSLLCETGPLGLFAFVWFMVAGLGLPRKARDGIVLGAAFAVGAFAVVAAFHDVLYDGQVGYNLVFALALATHAPAAREAER